MPFLCHTNSKIEKLLDNVIFSFKTLTDRVEFSMDKNNNEIDEEDLEIGYNPNIPVKVKEIHHS